MSLIQYPVQIIINRKTMQNFDVSIPIITDGAPPSAMWVMNNSIISLVYQLIKEQGYYEDPVKPQVKGDFEIKTNERGVLSLNIINYTYHYHAAHGLTIIKSLTFDISTGKNYQLSELFKPGSDYIGRINAKIQQQIKERDIPLLGNFKGISPEQDYYLADKSIVVYFQLYDLTPYVYGFPMFPISLYELQDIILENSPAGVMLQNI